MSHEIWDNDQFITVRQPGWHGLGIVLPDWPTRREAQDLAHPWEPVTEPVYLADVAFDADSETGELEPVTTYEEAPDFQAVRRSDDGSLLGIVGDGYVPVLNEEMWDIAEALQGTENDVMFETAGSLKGGRKTWILIRLAEPIEIEGDPNGATLPYFSLQNAHDGSGSFRGQATMTRIVCANTAQAADLDARQRGTEFMFRHSMNVKSRIEEARQALAGWRESIENYRLQQQHLLSLKMEPEAVAEFLERWIPAPPENHATERVLLNVEKARGQWREAYNSVTCEGIQGTAAGVLAASIEYAEHMRAAQSQDSRFARTYLKRNDVVQTAQKLTLSLV